MEPTEEMRRRYSRQTVLEEIGIEGQMRLLAGSVGIVGCGALGSMAAMQLAGAGVGRIGFADFDTIDISNLQRQLFFSEKDCGKLKCEILAERMLAINSGIAVEPLPSFLTPSSIDDWIARYDFIIEATDNSSSKFMVDKACEEMMKPCCIGGVRGFSGQISTFFGDGLRYRDIFCDVPEDGVTPCAMTGVIGPTAAIVASVQASEAIKWITGAGEPMSRRLLTFNLLNGDWNVIEL